MFKKSVLMTGVMAIGLMSATTWAASVNIWNVGSGQANGDFQVTESGIAGEKIQLGIRTTLRQLGNIVPSGNVYTVLPGTQGGIASEPVNPNRARWNFDFHIAYSGDISTLDALVLQISTVGGSTPAAPVIDLLNPFIRGAIDSQTNGSASATPTTRVDGLSDGPHSVSDGDPVHLYQASQNPVFGWFADPGPGAINGFDPNKAGDYLFTLTAVEGADRVSTQMVVRVVPLPVSVWMGLSLLGGLGVVRRIKKHAVRAI